MATVVMVSIIGDIASEAAMEAHFVILEFVDVLMDIMHIMDHVGIMACF